MTSKNITQPGSHSNHLNTANNNNNELQIDIQNRKHHSKSDDGCEPHDCESTNPNEEDQKIRHNNSHINKLWNYFKQCDDDPTKIECRLCSLHLCNRPTTATLWNHLKIKHSISKASVVSASASTSTNTINHNHNHNRNNKLIPQTNGLTGTSNQLDHLTNNDNHQNIPNNNYNNQTSTDNSIEPNRSSVNMTRTHYLNQQQPAYHHYGGKTRSSQQTNKTNTTSSGHKVNDSTSDKSVTTKNNKQESITSSSQIVLRRNLDLIDYNEISLVTSMKPSPSSSLSKNLISRLNLLSSPVTRKLKFWNKKSFQVNQYDPSFKVIYLGNLGMQFWSKDETCLEKPLSTLWNNYLVNMKTEIVMRLTICNSGLKAITRQHGLTQYWSNRLVYCCSHKNYPKIFSWIYRHEGKKMRQELRCHAVFCSSPEKAVKMVTLLNQRLACALQEFKREKKSSGPSIVTNNNNINVQQTLPRKIPLRRQILAKGSANFRPPLERSKSAPKLSSIMEDDYDLEEEDLYEVLQEEYEFEQSFDEPDDDDDDDEDDDKDEIDQKELDEEGTEYEGDQLDRLDDDCKEQESRTPNIESSSLSATVNEETSNSSVNATGDTLFGPLGL